MSSNINPFSVDGTFPIAGQDNSSQGFRDNFTNIKNNFVFAEAEITDLQNKALVTGALTGQTINNDMAGTVIRRPQLASWTQTLLDHGAVSGTAVLDFNSANFQKITTATPVALSFINWPASTGQGALGYGLMRVWIVVTDTAHTVTLPASVSIGIMATAWSSANNDGTNTITFDAIGDYIFDFSSIDGGTNYQIFDLSRNRATFQDPMIYFNAEVNSTFLIGYGPAALPLALALEQGEDKVSARGSYNSVSAGTHYTGNVAYTQGDNGPASGYSITGLRGNLDIGVINGIQNNDFIGYLNALTFTGNGASANVPVSTATIAFYARGTDPANGLGGNITLWTTPDGTGSTPFVAQKQAIGIENDQSVQFFGNVTIAGNLNVANVTYTNIITTTETVQANLAVTGNISVGGNVVYSDGSRHSSAKWTLVETIDLSNPLASQVSSMTKPLSYYLNNYNEFIVKMKINNGEYSYHATIPTPSISTTENYTIGTAVGSNGYPNYVHWANTNSYISIGISDTSTTANVYIYAR